MAELTSTKPYLLRAIFEWCVDNGLTPHLLVEPDEHTLVPQGFVRKGEITLNLSYTATKDLHIGNDVVTFSARFGGTPFSIYVPMDAVRGIFARENGQGMFFSPPEGVPPDDGGDTDGAPTQEATPAGKKPALKLVK
jgi:stringent starvation protein B